MMPFTPSMATCPDLAVPAEVMQHVVSVESGNNPFAIGVVGAQLERQPQNLDEAVATARMLETQGYNFSLGIAQVNRTNLARYGLDSYEKAFDTCANLAAGAQILARCYVQAGGDWGKSFSCYYSGNFTQGYADGYVQKVYDSIDRSAPPAPARAIPVHPSRTAPVQPKTGAEYLVRIRSSAIDATAAAVVANVAQAMAPTAQPSARTAPLAEPDGSQPTPSMTTPTANQAVASSNDIFEPLVRGPDDPATPPKENAPPRSPSADHADLRQGGRDDAFVF